jgi:hypothetical protein
MLAICAQCSSAQDAEKAGIICWFCGEAMNDRTRNHVGERGPSGPKPPKRSKASKLGHPRQLEPSVAEAGD